MIYVHVLCTAVRSVLIYESSTSYSSDKLHTERRLDENSASLTRNILGVGMQIYIYSYDSITFLRLTMVMFFSIWTAVHPPLRKKG